MLGGLLASLHGRRTILCVAKEVALDVDAAEADISRKRLHLANPRRHILLMLRDLPYLLVIEEARAFLVIVRRAVHQVRARQALLRLYVALIMQLFVIMPLIDDRNVLGAQV